jgi:hypothetical protein
MRSAAALTTLTLAALLLFGSVSTANAHSERSQLTPVQYRAKLNATCHSYWVKGRTASRGFKKAVKQKDAYHFGFYFGRLLVYTIAEDRVVERTPVPPSLRSVMTPTIKTLKREDALGIALFRDLTTGNSVALQKHSKALDKLNADPGLDRAGLGDCGSRQTKFLAG